MINLFIFILATSGLTFIATRSLAFKALREAITRNNYKNVDNAFMRHLYSFLDSVFNCYACFGFYAGGAIYLIQKLQFDLLLYCLIGSVVSLIIIDLIIFIERK